MKSKVKSDFLTLYSFYSAVDHHHHRYCHNRCWSPPLSSYCSIIMLLFVIVATGIRELMQAMFSNGGRKPEVNISHTRTVVSQIFKQILSTT